MSSAEPGGTTTSGDGRTAQTEALLPGSSVTVVRPEALERDTIDGRTRAVARRALAEGARVVADGLIAVPAVTTHGRVVAIVCVERASSESWSPLEVAAAEVLAHRSALEIELADARGELDRLAEVDRRRAAVAEERLAEEQRARRRAEALRNLAERLIGAGSVEDVIGVIVEHAAAAIDAVFSNVALPRGDGSELELRHGASLRSDVAGRWPVIHIDSDAPLAVATRTRSMVWAADPTELASRFPSGATDAAASGLQALASVPVLGANGEVLLTIGVAWNHPQELTNEMRNALVTATALTAQAITRAERFDAERALTQELQRHLLPAVLPRRHGIDVAAVYQSAVATLDVGGDWYDVIELPGDRLLLVVGDVVGRGVAAAATVGQLRSALRALAPHEPGPAELLDRLDPFVDGIPSALATTVALVEVAADRGEIRYALAGHPPPLLLAADGTSTWLEGGRSVPLGIAPEGRRPAGVLEWAVDTTLVLYTDGLVERRGEHLDVGLARLQASAGDAVGPARALLQRVLGELVATGSADDVCMLAARRTS